MYDAPAFSVSCAGEDFLPCYVRRSEVQKMVVVRRTVVKCCKLNDTFNYKGV